MNLQVMLCADPLYGNIYRHLFNGGSWYEADQMHWRIVQQHAAMGLQELIESKPTKSNQDKAQTFLGQLKETTVQLLPQSDSMKVFLEAEQVVKTWTPAAKTLQKTQDKANKFALLDDDE